MKIRLNSHVRGLILLTSVAQHQLQMHHGIIGCIMRPTRCNGTFLITNARSNPLAPWSPCLLVKSITRLAAPHAPSVLIVAQQWSLRLNWCFPVGRMALGGEPGARSVCQTHATCHLPLGTKGLVLWQLCGWAATTFQAIGWGPSFRVLEIKRDFSWWPANEGNQSQTIWIKGHKSKSPEYKCKCGTFSIYLVFKLLFYI